MEKIIGALVLTGTEMVKKLEPESLKIDRALPKLDISVPLPWNLLPGTGILLWF
jgi:hypothetical protein